MTSLTLAFCGTRDVHGLVVYFFFVNADLSDLLLVTGMPGCSDIMSINRVLKIFASLISMADSKTDNPYNRLLKSLDKLASIRESVSRQAGVPVIIIWVLIWWQVWTGVLCFSSVVLCQQILFKCVYSGHLFTRACVNVYLHDTCLQVLCECIST